MLERFIIYLESDLEAIWAEELEPVKDDIWIVNHKPTDRLFVDAKVLVRDRAEREAATLTVKWAVEDAEGKAVENGDAVTDDAGIASFTFQAPKIDFYLDKKPYQVVKIYHEHPSMHEEDISFGPDGRIFYPPDAEQPEEDKPIAKLKVYYKPKLFITFVKDGIRETDEPIEVEYPDEVVLEPMGIVLKPKLLGFINPVPPERWKPDASPEAAREKLKLSPPANLRKTLTGSKYVTNAKLTYQGETSELDVWHEEDEYRLTFERDSKPQWENIEIEFQLESKLETAFSKLLFEVETTSKLDEFSNVAADLDQHLEKVFEQICLAKPKEYDVDKTVNGTWSAAEVLRNLRSGVEDLDLALPLYERAYNRVITMSFTFIIDLFSPDFLDEAARKIVAAGPKNMLSVAGKSVDEVQAALLKTMRNSKFKWLKTYYAALKKSIADIPEAIQAIADYRKHLRRISTKVDDMLAAANRFLDEIKAVAKTKKGLLENVKTALKEKINDIERNFKAQRTAAQACDAAEEQLGLLRKTADSLKRQKQFVADELKKVEQALSTGKASNPNLAKTKLTQLRQQFNRLQREILETTQNRRAWQQKLLAAEKQASGARTAARELAEQKAKLQTQMTQLNDELDEIALYFEQRNTRLYQRELQTAKSRITTEFGEMQQREQFLQSRLDELKRVEAAIECRGCRKVSTGRSVNFLSCRRPGPPICRLFRSGPSGKTGSSVIRMLSNRANKNECHGGPRKFGESRRQNPENAPVDSALRVDQSIDKRTVYRHQGRKGSRFATSSNCSTIR